jgi:transposase
LPSLRRLNKVPDEPSISERRVRSVARFRQQVRSIAMRYQHLGAEIDTLDTHLDQLVAEMAPALVAIKGVGTDIASTRMTIAGDDPERLASEVPSLTWARSIATTCSGGSSDSHDAHKVTRWRY